MKLKAIALTNWKNFDSLSVDVADLLFVTGINASGKSNFLDAILFMKDIAKHGGGLQYAILKRGGFSGVYCLSAKGKPYINLSFEFAEDNGVMWRYTFTILKPVQRGGGALIGEERIEKGDTVLVSRPNNKDKEDDEQLSQTYLEQTNTNKEFRTLVSYFVNIRYINLIPQLLKHPEIFYNFDQREDLFGRDLLNDIALTPESERENRLKAIRQILLIANPQLDNMRLITDIGTPHLEIRFKHWKRRNARQLETELSDGMLRLIGLFWQLTGGQSLFLIEEPELHLHCSITEHLPRLFNSVKMLKKCQIISTTNSTNILLNEIRPVPNILRI